jgi:hypothetical protein
MIEVKWIRIEICNLFERRLITYFITTLGIPHPLEISSECVGGIPWQKGKWIFYYFCVSVYIFRFETVASIAEFPA